MDALEVLERLAELRVVAVLEDSRLFLEPGSRVPPELIREVKAHRNEIVGALRSRQVPADTGLRPLLERLKRDQMWLTLNFHRHMTTEPVGDPEFVSCRMAWVVLERLLRQLYPHYEDCISETGACDPAAPVWCSHCAGVSSTTSGEPVP